MKEEYEFMLAVITKEDKPETIWNLLNMISENITELWLENAILYPEEFLKYLIIENKISNILYKKILYSDDYIKNHTLSNILNSLFDSFEKICKRDNKKINCYFFNYLLSEYIFNNLNEKKYFYSEFIPITIEKINENSESDFFENIKPYKINYCEVKDIKLYYFVSQYRHEKKYELDQQIQAQELFDKDINSYKDSLIRDINNLIESNNEDENVLKSDLKNLKSQINKLFTEKSYLL